MIDSLSSTDQTRSSDRTDTTWSEALVAVDNYAKQHPPEGDPLRLLQLMAAHC